MKRTVYLESEIEQIAKVCHEINKAYCETEGDLTQSEWNKSPEWQKASAIDGVRFHLFNEVSPEQSHVNWSKTKIADGWVYGEIKDPEAKTHPCLIEYEELPEFQRNKDLFFKTVVDSFK